MKKGEWILWGAAALLLIVTCALAAAGAPDFAPITVVYSDAASVAPASSQASLPEAPDSAPASERPPESPSSPASPGTDESRTPSTSSLVPSSAAPISSAPPLGKINLNTAGKEELMSIKGLGEVFAGRIIEYRERHGGFDSLEELMEVDGIGEKRYEAWKPYLTL